MTEQALPPDLSIDLRQLVMTIANTVDLVGVDDLLHGRRVGMLARELACQLGWDEKVQLLLYDAGLLHECGVSSTRVHRRLIIRVRQNRESEGGSRGGEVRGNQGGSFGISSSGGQDARSIWLKVEEVK